MASELAGSSTSLRQAKAENQSLKKERDELIFAQQRLHEVEQRALERDARIGELVESRQTNESAQIWPSLPRRHRPAYRNQAD